MGLSFKSLTSNLAITIGILSKLSAQFLEYFSLLSNMICRNTASADTGKLLYTYILYTSI